MGIVDASKAAGPYSDPAIIEVSKMAAENAVLVARDDLGVLPVDRSKKVLLINQQNSMKCPNDSWDHPGLFQEIMEDGWPELQTYETTFGSTAEQDAEVMAFVEANDFDLILCTNYYDRQIQPNTYAKQLIEAGQPVVLMTNTPYCIGEVGGCIPGAKTILLNMNFTPEGLRTVKRVLFGDLEPKGRWPVSNYDPFNLVKS
jgi:beta-N-acetylhexosaminidase